MTKTPTDTKPDKEVCPTCEGYGIRLSVGDPIQGNGGNLFVTLSTRCPTCSGTGTIKGEQ